jgi:hypothetical protein
VIASAPIAAAPSERRLNWLRDMGFLLGKRGFDGSLERQSPFAIGVGLPDVPRYAVERALLPPRAHEFVNKSVRLRDFTTRKNPIHGAVPSG